MSVLVSFGWVTTGVVVVVAAVWLVAMVMGPRMMLALTAFGITSVLVWPSGAGPVARPTAGSEATAEIIPAGPGREAPKTTTDPEPTAVTNSPFRQTMEFNGPRVNGFGDQCTAYAVDRMHEQTGLWMRTTGHAGEWVRTAVTAGWTVGEMPAARSILVMPPGDEFEYVSYTATGVQHTRLERYGHVGWVERLDQSREWALISDQNWDGTGQLGGRWVHVTNTPARFIYSDQ